MGFINKLFEGGEENILTETAAIGKIALEANSLIHFLKSDKSVLSKIRALEKKSDAVVFRLTEKSTSGAIAPNLIDNILMLIDKEDDIVDSILNLSREITRYNIKNRRVDDIVSNMVSDSVSLSEEAIKLLSGMVVSQDLEEIKRLRHEIEKLEEKGDDVKDNLIDFAYTLKDDFKGFYHIIQVAHQADNVLDNCEDSANLFMTIMSSIVT